MTKQASSRGLHRLLPFASILLPGMVYAIAGSGATLKASLTRPALPVTSTTASETPSAKFDYARDIEPIFKANCVKCHGGETMMGGLRLDVKSYAMQGGDSGPVIVPGSSEKSLLVQRILGLGGKPQMPKGAAPLSADEIAKIRGWIDGGATWQADAAPLTHWAFIAPRRPDVPVVHRSAWPQNPIDNFILARLEKEGMQPSPWADRPTIIRRVYLDLTGIPPLPTELDAFVNDKSPDAYAKVVDRLLASPRYGERMAMDWLDGARYADSNGYQADYERFQWRWRDWVINAFNQNKPFDQFTIEQIAGDLLPNATLDQKIATGFNRNHRINTEGGVIPEEWRVETVIDRVETTSQVWLGLTMGCARCHNHKYDPITQKDFYSFYHYFNNVSESGTGEERAVNHPPFIKAPTPEQTARLAALDTQLKGADSWLADRVVANLPRAAGWKLGSGANADGSLLDGLVARYALSAKPHVAAGTAPAPILSGPVGTDAGHTSGAVVTANGAFVDLGNVGD
nr:DUF1549 domain-containing protein [Armatimonadota bacterium]